MVEKSEKLTLRFNEQAYSTEKDKGRAQRRWEDREARWQVKTVHRILESHHQKMLARFSLYTNFDCSWESFDTCYS